MTAGNPSGATFSSVPLGTLLNVMLRAFRPTGGATDLLDETAGVACHDRTNSELLGRADQKSKLARGPAQLQGNVQNGIRRCGTLTGAVATMVKLLAKSNRKHEHRNELWRQRFTGNDVPA